MQHRFLVTGGAGFIGTRLVARLTSLGPVGMFDSLHPQVHGEAAAKPVLPPEAVFVQGDIRDSVALSKAFRELRPTVVFHLAAETGTGQSFDEVARYCDANVTGTAQVIEAIRAHGPDVRRIVLASSRAVYGEGPYRHPDGSIRMAAPRSVEKMAKGDFEVRCPATGHPLTSVPANSRYGVAPSSVYGTTKLMQEYLLAQTSAGASWTPAVLRFQNVFGPGQSLRNPYTGVLSIFCSQLLSGKGVDIFEDGNITRDFVFIDDVVEALMLSGDPARQMPDDPIDIGFGAPSTILEAARELVRSLGLDPSLISISGRFRPGDIRSASADTTQARQVLEWRPRTSMAEGLHRLAQWSAANYERSIDHGGVA